MADDYTFRDALPRGPQRGRGAGLNPGNRFEPIRLHVLGEFLDEEQNDPDRGGAGRTPTQVFADQTRKLINRVAKTSDVPFDWTINPYRGCEHGCIYCFARPYHEYLGFSSGLDFETKIVAKMDAPQLLVEELASPSWKGEPIVMSAITDIYQPIEKKLELSRRCIEVMADCAQPVSTMTKNALVLRDAELWARMSRQNTGRVTVTLVTLDEKLARDLEPRAAAPARRLRVIRELVKAGVQVSVNVAPVIPGLTDKEMPAILGAIADAGAKRAAWVMLRLPYQLKELFLDWLRRCVPDRASHVESLIRQTQGGKLYKATPDRHRGRGEHAAQIARMFDVFTRKYGLNRDIRPMRRDRFRRPNLHGQLGLFG
jgi:DNA repair photolyase